jgi:SAM-dependent methyltransferase
MNELLAYLKKRRAEIDDWMTRNGTAHTISLARYNLWRKLMPLLDSYARSPCLDAGSGRSPYKRQLESRGIKVISVDRENRTGKVDLVADIQDLSELDDSSLQMVLCTQVLEHVPNPALALSEFSRVLATGGFLILTVPHLSMLHEEPHDYWRYTRHGLRELLEKQGFDIIEIAETGGLISFFGHICSLALWSSLGNLPGMRRLTWFSNYFLLIQLLRPLDRLVGLKSLYPLDYVLVAQKSGVDEDE